jgi:hypothetical protein
MTIKDNPIKPACGNDPCPPDCFCSNWVGDEPPEEQQREKHTICGFSMGAPVLRECIKSGCKFWIDAEQERKDVAIGMAFAGILGHDNDRLIEELKRTSNGYCVFEVFC